MAWVAVPLRWSGEKALSPLRSSVHADGGYGALDTTRDPGPPAPCRRTCTTFSPVRHAERLHEPGPDVCPCGTLLPDLRSQSMPQAWCRTLTRSRASERR